MSREIEKLDGLKSVYHKMYEAVLHVKKTEGQVRELCKDDIGPPETDEDIRNMVKFYELLDGITAFVSDTLSFVSGEYAFLGATKEYDDRHKEACWLMEQDEFCGAYKNRRKDFDKHWSNGEYWPYGVLQLKADEVEIIREMQTRTTTRNCRKESHGEPD